VVVLDQTVQTVAAHRRQRVGGQRDGWRHQTDTASQSANEHDDHAESSISAEKAACQ
jgi:hypothetical protein